MAKKKTSLTKTEEDVDLLNQIIKKYGHVIKTGSDVLNEREDYSVLSVSPVMDVALGGGIKEGSWVMLSGPPKTGKTTLAMQLVYNCQQEDRPILYVNAEGRLKEMNFEIHGLDPSKMQIVSAENKPLSAEDFLDIVYKFVSAKENAGCLCVIDSISSLIPKRDLEQDISGETRPGLPKILSDFVKKLGQIVPNQRAIVVMITHIINNTSGYGSPKMADGGVKIQFQSDTRLEVKSITPWVQDNEQIGQAVNWKVWWSSIGPPGAECQSWIRYGHGIDNIQEIIMMGQEAGFISQNGAWMTCNFLLLKPELLKEIHPDLELVDGAYKDIEKATRLCKFQGSEKLYHFINSQPKVYEALIEDIKQML